jgi:hypothetical protein
LGRDLAGNRLVAADIFCLTAGSADFGVSKFSGQPAKSPEKLSL